MDQSISSVSPPTLNRRLTTFLHAVLFVLGFSLVFIVGWGGAATTLGRLFGQYKVIIGQIGGIVVIVFGLVTLGVLKLPWLYYELILYHYAYIHSFSHNSPFSKYNSLELITSG